MWPVSGVAAASKATASLLDPVGRASRPHHVCVRLVLVHTSGACVSNLAVALPQYAVRGWMWIAMCIIGVVDPAVQFAARLALT